MNSPFFSIVVPTFNRASLIVRTLESLKRLEYTNYEIIIVDDGSTDNTSEVVKPFLDERTRYHRKENSERAASRNFGAKISKGEYINFFDSDDIALPNHLAEAAKLVQSHRRIEWFHLGFAWSTPEGKIFKEVNNFRGETLNNLLPDGNVLSCNSVFIRKDIICSNHFNEDRDLSASEDYELWLRLAAKYPLYYTNTITSHIIDHDLRSVHKTNLEKLELRINLLLFYLKQNTEVMKHYEKVFGRIKAEGLSYIALHIAHERKHKKVALKYLLGSVVANPAFIKRKRFYAIIKNFMIKW
ncbi:MAG TPA: glycosyltransferase family A protein [Flavisolibacter sp.]|jgi:glycosyltransferase involved in cell wall biosynthesis|nr:glycosyltransferase family A protein [Flavisolibacter sp.]